MKLNDIYHWIKIVAGVNQVDFIWSNTVESNNR